MASLLNQNYPFFMDCKNGRLRNFNYLNLTIGWSGYNKNNTVPDAIAGTKPIALSLIDSSSVDTCILKEMAQAQMEIREADVPSDYCVWLDESVLDYYFYYRMAVEHTFLSLIPEEYDYESLP